MALLYLYPLYKRPHLKELPLKATSKLPVCEMNGFYNMEAHHRVGRQVLYYCLNHFGLV